MNCDLLISGGKLVIPGEGILEADLLVTGERISGIVAPDTTVEALRVIDARGLHVLPGGIDPHTHWGNYGSFEEDAHSESRSAAIGGTTTALLFQRIAADNAPSDAGRFVNLPFSQTKALAEDQSVIDFAFSPIIHDEESGSRVDSLVDSGCTSFKFYLAYRDVPGAPDGDNWNRVDDGMLLDFLANLAKKPGSLACVHAENAEILTHTLKRAKTDVDGGLLEWDMANPAIAEVEAIQRAGLFAQTTGSALYIVHLSGEDSLESLKRVQGTMEKAYGETCVHYLLHNRDESPTTVKYSPPVRTKEDAETLWSGLADGTLSCVASDSVCTPAELKQGSIWEMGRGEAAAGVRLPAVLSKGVNEGRLSLEQAVRVTSENAARIFGLYPRKGVLAVGSDADIVLVNLAKSRRVSEVFPNYGIYEDFELEGWPEYTLVRGQLVAKDGEIVEHSPSGQFVARQLEASA